LDQKENQLLLTAKEEVEITKKEVASAKEEIEAIKAEKKASSLDFSESEEEALTRSFSMP
ncbi:TPA: hypothetical protein VJS49_001819, partial [Streptococcus pyogenes]|nr:hypothetical protein [Streptococcus pyogenes]